MCADAAISTIVTTNHFISGFLIHTKIAQTINITDAKIHVRYTHICGNNTNVVIVLPRNDQIVEINSIFHAAYHLVHCDTCVIIGIVWDAKYVGIAKKSNANENNVGIYQMLCNSHCNTASKLGYTIRR